MSHSARRGFTLIELLVTVSIMAFLMIYGSISITSSRKNQSLKKAQQQLKLGLEKAKNDAFFGKKPAACGAIPLLGMRFVLSPGDPPAVPASYKITVNCVVSAGDPEPEVVSFEFEKDVHITPAINMIFNTLNNGTNLSGTQTFNVTVDGLSAIRSVTVNKSGVINAND